MARRDLAAGRRPDAEAGVTVVTVGVFSWARLQPEPQAWDDGWLLRILDLLHVNGIAVDLATAHGVTPAVAGQAAPGDPSGRRHRHPDGDRQQADLVRQFAGFPGVFTGSGPASWRAASRIIPPCGCGMSPTSWATTTPTATAMSARIISGRWLADRYGDIHTLNRSWGTAFWSQHYSSFDEIGVPSATTAFGNPGQLLDWRRFSSDVLLDQYRAEKAVLREISPAIPVTTNFLVGIGPGEIGPGDCDYAAGRREQDVVSNDHYLIGLGTGEQAPRLHLEFSADLTRGLAGGRPWWLMEHSTSAVNWQRINRAKEPGEMERNSLAHLARGADAICFFQFRQSVIGAEKYHSAMLPHAGPDSRRWRDVCALGELIGRLGEVAGRGSRPRPRSWWTGIRRGRVQQDAHPSATCTLSASRCWRTGRSAGTGTGCDVIPVGADLSGYRVVVVPAVALLSADTAARLAAVAQAAPTSW